ncbi:hypothetical protein H6P81_015540 [Aristolochia fimbriata]|uniref:Uncharacterized protein n=1 Tax=Aristolochia fimbriata TaxID=158543 RepID=A0AAV7E5S4_ARIFI|nr:hypothetical protein H6P81_015540 [Aristolochia fimbriata]
MEALFSQFSLLEEEALQDKNFDPARVDDLIKLFEQEAHDSWADMEAEANKGLKEAERSLTEAADELNSLLFSSMKKIHKLEKKGKQEVPAELYETRNLTPSLTKSELTQTRNLTREKTKEPPRRPNDRARDVPISEFRSSLSRQKKPISLLLNIPTSAVGSVVVVVAVVVNRSDETELILEVLLEDGPVEGRPGGRLAVVAEAVAAATAVTAGLRVEAEIEGCEGDERAEEAEEREQKGGTDGEENQFASTAHRKALFGWHHASLDTFFLMKQKHCRKVGEKRLNRAESDERDS